MEKLEQKIKEYISSVSVPEEILPHNIKSVIEDSGDITAGIFLKRLKDLKISGSEFLELLGNSKIGNAEFRRIEENPHLKFDELLHILDNSTLSSDDYRMIISVASQRRAVREERKKREQEALVRLKKDLGKTDAVEEKPFPSVFSDDTENNTAVTESVQQVSDEAVTENNNDVNDYSTSADSDTPAENSYSSASEFSTPTDIEDEDEAETTEETAISEPETQADTDYSDTADDDTDYHAVTDIEDDIDDSNSVGAMSAAEALLAKYQADIDRELGITSDFYQKTVNSSEKYTDSISISDNQEQQENSDDSTTDDEYRSYESDIDNTDTIADDYSDDEDTSKESTMEFCIPESSVLTATESSDEDSDYSDSDSSSDTESDTDYEYRKEYKDEDDEDEIGSSAEDIGQALGELLDENDKIEPVSGVSRKAIIAAFVCAAVVVLCACTMKILRYYDIIPTYTYKIPTLITQNIVDFTSLFDETKAASDKVSYNMPEGFSQKQDFMNNRHNAVGNTVCAAISIKDGKEYLCGAKTADGKVSSDFSFDTGMTNATITYADNRFILSGVIGNMTVIRFYDEASLIEGKHTKEIKLSGKSVGSYTDGNAFYAVTSDIFDMKSSGSDTLSSFIPSFTENDKTSVVPFDKIVLPETAGNFSYYTVTRIPYDNSATTYKSVMTGASSGIHLTGGSAYICDNLLLNEKYTSRLICVTLNEELSVNSADINGAINPAHLLDNGVFIIASGITFNDDKRLNAVFRFTKELSDPAVLSGVATDSIIDKAYCGDEILSLITAGENPMQYNINISDLSAVGSDKPVRLTKRITDKMYAGVHVTYDQSGKRTGLVLTVSENGKTAEITANADSTVQGDWNSYIDSTTISDISLLPVYHTDKKTIIALPVTYFDGISQVSEFRFYSYEKGQIMAMGKISLYDEQYSTAYCGFSGGEKPYILTLWDNRIITADIETIKVISDTKIGN